MIETAVKIVIRVFCSICWTDTFQTFVRDEGRFEIYACDTCGTEHKIAVR